MVKLRAQQLTLPCVCFQVYVRRSEGAGKLTPIEQITLKAIGAGLEDVSELTRTLRLGKRPMLDLIYDFWQKGYVVVDTDQATVQLTGAAAEAHRAGELAELDSAENNLELLTLMQELVTGAVLPDVGRRVPPGPESALVPTRRTEWDLGSDPNRSCLDAIRRANVLESRQKGRALNVIEAWPDPGQLAPSGLQQPRERRFLPLLVDVSSQPNSGRLVFEIIDAPELPPVIRREIEVELTNLADHFVDHMCFRNLRKRMAAESEVGGGVVDPIGSLTRSLAGLEDTDPGLVERRHADLARMYRAAHEELEVAERAQARVRALFGDEAHDTRIARMLEEARHQVVLCNPWLSVSALIGPRPAGSSLYDLLERALDRGVRIALLWGVKVGERLNPEVQNALTRLQKGRQDRFVWSDRPSVTHGKFVICDATAALITSYNFLHRSSQGETLEVGVLVEGVQPGQTTTAVIRLLRWARDTFPDHVLGQRILVLPLDLGATEPPPPPSRIPQRPAAEVLQAAPEVTPAIRHWAAEWRTSVEALVAARQRCRRPAELLVDKGHREALAQALQQSARRLAILSDKLSVDVVTDAFTAELRQRLAEGVSCALMYQRHGASDVAAGPGARLKRLVAEFPRSLSLTEASSHAKILVSDDEVVVGSFNFLSFGSDYNRSARAERSELSIRVRDPEIVDAILKVLADPWPAAFTPLVERRAPELALPAALAVPRSLQPLFQRLESGRSPGVLLLEWFAERPDPWADLASLEESGVSEPLLAQAVGAAIARAAELDGPEGRRWRGWLAEQRWQSRDFVGSALLMPPDVTGPLGLEGGLARLAAAVEAPRLVAEPPAELLTRAGQLEATALLGVVDLLAHGREALMPWLERAADRLPRHVQRWVRAALTYNRRHFGALPMALLRRSLGRRAHRQQVEAARERFRQALYAAEIVNFLFPLGQHTWDRLRTPEYPLGKMRTMLEADDAASLGEYFVELARAGTDFEQIMDAVSYELRDSHNDRIELRKRSVCLKRLRYAEAAARAWIDLASAAVPSPDEIFQLTACREVRASLLDLAYTSASPLTPLAEPVRGFARTRLQALLETEET